MNLEVSIEILNDIQNILKDMKSSSQFKEELSYLLNQEISYLKDFSKHSKQEVESPRKEVANIGVGTRVSWDNHLGSFSGTVTEVHYARVRRVVRNIRMYNDGLGYDHEITRVGTHNNPALVIEVIGASGGLALMLLNQINIDELKVSN
ncbi:MAG: hypothetical protein DRQ39_07120 [Gammaproteobacteria bacterium]|nr:MAG: hypothetical protein DRQ39_07120 [Gammaproteobacteria bacterium]